MAPRWLFPEPFGPTSNWTGLGHRGHASRVLGAPAFSGAIRKSSRAQLVSCGQSSVDCRDGGVTTSFPALRCTSTLALRASNQLGRNDVALQELSGADERERQEEEGELRPALHEPDPERKDHRGQ